MEFAFDDNVISDDDTLKGVLAMFSDLQIVRTLHVDYQVLFFCF